MYLDKHRFEYLHFQYIYPISYRNAKKGKPSEISLPFLENDITTSEPICTTLDT
jgi:hypothetical protein